MRRSLQFDYMAARKASSIAPGPRSPLPFQRTMSALGGGSEVGEIRKEKERRYSWRRGLGVVDSLGWAGPGRAHPFLVLNRSRPAQRSQRAHAAPSRFRGPAVPAQSLGQASVPARSMPSSGSDPVHAKLRLRPGPCQAPAPARSMARRESAGAGNGEDDLFPVGVGWLCLHFFDHPTHT